MRLAVCTQQIRQDAFFTFYPIHWACPPLALPLRQFQLKACAVYDFNMTIMWHRPLKSH